MGMCKCCPKRDMAALLRALGEKDHADRIERDGCPDWLTIRYESTSGAIRDHEGCAKELLIDLMFKQGARVEESLQTAQSVRNVADKVREASERAVEMAERAASMQNLFFDAARSAEWLLGGVDLGVLSVPEANYHTHSLAGLKTETTKDADD